MIRKVQPTHGGPHRTANLHSFTDTFYKQSQNTVQWVVEIRIIRDKAWSHHEFFNVSTTQICMLVVHLPVRVDLYVNPSPGKAAELAQ